MGTVSDLPDFSDMDDDEFVRHMNRNMGHYMKVLSKRKRAASKLKYQIKLRGEQDQKQFNQIRKYHGPDEDTQRVLREYTSGWNAQPSTFWSPPGASDEVRCSGEAGLVGHYIKTYDTSMHQMRRVYPNQGTWSNEIANILCNPGNTYFEHDEVVKDARQMLQEGNRMLFLEHMCGRGVTFVLGTQLPKTFWTKQSRKSGERYDVTMNVLKEAKIPEKAKEYAKLRDDVIRVKMESLKLDLPDDLWPVSSPTSTSVMPMLPFMDIMEQTNGAMIDELQYEDQYLSTGCGRSESFAGSSVLSLGPVTMDNSVLYDQHHGSQASTSTSGWSIQWNGGNHYEGACQYQFDVASIEDAPHDFAMPIPSYYMMMNDSNR